MVKRMLMDATHPEETRVVVLDGTRLEEFDVETSTKKQIKGNIYLAKVVRVEPSLTASACSLKSSVTRMRNATPKPRRAITRARGANPSTAAAIRATTITPA